jgi:hypothetical protein
MVLGVACSSSAIALDSETFDDFTSVGAGADARKRPAPLAFDGHNLEPSFAYKLLDFLTPHAFGGETVGYTDNVLLTPSPSTHSIFEKTTVGGRGDVQLDEHIFSAGYRASETDYPGLDNRTWLFEQQADARLDLNFNELQAHADGFYGRYGYPSLVQIVGFAPEQVYFGQLWVEGSWNRVGGKVGASARRDDFESTGEAFALRGLDKKTFGVDAQANFKILEKLEALLEYDFERDNFDRTTGRDFDAHQMRVGLDGTLGEKLALSLKFGYTYQELHGSSASFQDSKHYSGYNAACAASWQVLPELTLSAAYRHDLTFAVGADYESVDSIDVGAAFKFGPNDKLTARAGFTWSRQTPDTGSHFDRIQCIAAVSYAIQKWLDVQAYYQYSQGLGNQRFAAVEYDEHRVGLSIAVGF